MNFAAYASIIVRHPLVVLSAVAILSATCIIIPFTLPSSRLPNFKDPQLGFSTRGTKISNRLTTWTNLIMSTRSSGPFTANPKEFLYLKAKSEENKTGKPKTTTKPRPKKTKKPKRHKSKEPVFGSETLYPHKNEDDVIAELNRWKAVQKLNRTSELKVEDVDVNFFCGNPDEQYAHLVVSKVDNSDLFNAEDLISMCRLEHELTHFQLFRHLCVENHHGKCCKPWSLPNYVAFTNKKSSCFAITEEDVEATKKLLKNCAQYYHSSVLNSQCLVQSPFCEAPLECVRHDTVFNVLHFITTTTFLGPNSTDNLSLNEAMIFLPLAASTAILPYYYHIGKMTLNHGAINIVGIDFGIKNTLFDELLITDTYLIGSGAMFVFLCMWVYTRSLFLTIMALLAIFFSLGISYFLYSMIFDIRFFPFMNILAVIVAIGIGSDDAFIFCKIWYIQKQTQNGTMLQMMTETFQHAFISMFVTAITTAVAFLGSYVSSITAVSCFRLVFTVTVSSAYPIPSLMITVTFLSSSNFKSTICWFSIFAGTAVIVNYFLMITWFPATIVIWERSCLSDEAFFPNCMLLICQRVCCFKYQFNLSPTWCRYFSIDAFLKFIENWVINFIIKFKYFVFTVFMSLAIASGLIVFVHPKLRLPNSNEFQLFKESHLFEQYDFKYKDRFWFSQNQQETFKLPLRFVWGVLPVDNGDYLDPANLGNLTLDPDFDMSDPESQVWLLNFCQKIREQPFYQSMMGPLLPNCFVETFMNSMDRKCYDSFLEEDRTPCCETSKFPFNKTVFDKCIIDEIADIYNTPSNLMSPSMAGPKFSKDQNPTIKIVVIEYDSTFSYTMSYEEMNEFFNTVENWMAEELRTAPPSMKNGWFISEFAFYDLQRELNVSTELAILISMVLALVVLFFSTLNILTSLYAIFTICSSIFVTLSALVLLDWRLNVLESTAISTAIGLTVDFSLHYSVNYRLRPPNLAGNREAATRYALNYMAGPAFMAAVTTGAAGAFMLPSLILPYIQIGIFLVLVMSISWMYATFMLGALLAIAGPIKNCGQVSFGFFKRLFTRSERDPEPPVPPSTISDHHELESLTLPTIQTTTHKILRRSISADAEVRYVPNKFSLTDQSPSGTSAITIMVDDN